MPAKPGWHFLTPQSWTDSPTQMERIILEASGIQGDHEAVVETAREALVIGGLNVLFCSRQYDNGGRTGLRYTAPSVWSYPAKSIHSHVRRPCARHPHGFRRDRW